MYFFHYLFKKLQNKIQLILYFVMATTTVDKCDIVTTVVETESIASVESVREKRGENKGQNRSERNKLLEELDNTTRRLPPSALKRRQLALVDPNVEQKSEAETKRTETEANCIKRADVLDDVFEEETVNSKRETLLEEIDKTGKRLPPSAKNRRRLTLLVKEQSTEIPEKKEVEATDKNGPRRSKRQKYNKPIENDRLTPMGLPKPTRLPKEAEVSIEDIYLQKDYRTPKTSSSLATIIDENNPKVTKAVMTKQKKKRTIQFSTDPAARKPKKRRMSVRSTRGKTKRDSIESMNILKQKLEILDHDIARDDNTD